MAMCDQLDASAKIRLKATACRTTGQREHGSAPERCGRRNASATRPRQKWRTELPSPFTTLLSRKETHETVRHAGFGEPHEVFPFDRRARMPERGAALSTVSARRRS